MDWKTARVIFVCSGNICRSPMAAGLSASMLAESGARPMIISMGTLNLVGRSADRHAVAAMKEIGIDISRHRSQGLNPMMLKMADVVFVMEPRHTQAIRRVAPGARVQLLSSFDEPKQPEVRDPVGGTLEDFRACRVVLRRCLAGAFERL